MIETLPVLISCYSCKDLVHKDRSFEYSLYRSSMTVDKIFLCRAIPSPYRGIRQGGASMSWRCEGCGRSLEDLSAIFFVDKMKDGRIRDYPYCRDCWHSGRYKS